MTLPEAAAALGVHYMTAYRYVRTGRLPAVRAGAHWEVDPADVDRLSVARRCRSTGASHHAGRPGVTGRSRHSAAGDRASDVERSGDGALSEKRPGDQRTGEARTASLALPGETAGVGSQEVSLAAGLQRRLVYGDEAAVWSIVQDLMAWGADPTSIVVDVLAPAMVAIGEEWARGTISVGEEHRASQVTTRIQSRLGPSLARRGRRRGTVVMGSPAGERHGLPVIMAVDVVRGAGWEVIDLGPDTPAAAFAQAASSAPRLVAVAVGVTLAGQADAVRGIVSAVEAVGPVPVVLGGAGVSNGFDALAMGANVWSGGDARQLVAVLDALVRGALPEHSGRSRI